MTTETRPCPFCGEEIKAVAIKCRFCGSLLAEGRDTELASREGAPSWDVGGYQDGVLRVGSAVREYRVEAVLGRGGMGEVCRCVHVQTGQVVAIKVIAAALIREEHIRQRFLREASAMAGLAHPNLVRLLTFFEEHGRLFLVMEYVDGRDLEGLLESRRLDIREAIDLTLQVLAGLEHGHTRPKPVIHRDIKPANVLLGKDGRAVVTDFGISKTIGADRFTRTGVVVGTYEYMSPEQILGTEIGPASDLYSVGVMLFQMLAGIVPFPHKSDSGLEVMKGHTEGVVPSLVEFREDVPEWLERVVRRALEKDPSRRFASAREMADALRSGGAGLPQTRVGPPFRESNAGSGQEEVQANGKSSSLWVWIVAFALPTLLAVVLFGFMRDADDSDQDATSVAHVGARGDGGAKGMPTLEVGLPAIEAGAGRPMPDKESLPELRPVSLTDPGSPPAAAGASGQPTSPSVSPPCVPDCRQRFCGPDGCGGVCGTCPGSMVCVNGSCACQPNCDGRKCGPDGCGGVCGTCPGSMFCVNGSCACRPNCVGRDCGPDGCGGTCGSCSAGWDCVSGSCNKRALPCSIEALNCSPGLNSGDSAKEIQKQAYLTRKDGNYAAALCMAEGVLQAGLPMDSLTAGRMYYEMSFCWNMLGCREAACAAVRDSLRVRPQEDKGFEVTCDHCKDLGCGYCPNCP